MFKELVTALAQIEQSPQRATELRAALKQQFAAMVTASDSPELAELLQAIGFAEHSGFDVQPAIEALNDLLAALLTSEDPHRPEKSQRVRRQFQDFSGERVEKPAFPTAPPPGAVRLAAIAPPRRRFA